MKKRLIAFASLFLMLLTVFSKPVYAKTLLQESETVSGQEVIGSLKIYDDYTVKVEYTYAVKDIEIIVCKANLCQDSELMRHKDNQDYFDGEYVEKMSFLLDVRTFIGIISTVALGKNVYKDGK